MNDDPVAERFEVDRKGLAVLSCRDILERGERAEQA